MEIIQYSENNAVATIRLNHPETYHSLTVEMMNRIIDYLSRAEKNKEIRCIVLTASGKAFCSGQNLNEYSNTEEIDFEGVLKNQYETLVRQIRDLPKPVICGLNGVAAGAGASLALACDIILASNEAYLSLAFIQIGLIPDGACTYFLPRITGIHRAMGLMMTGDKVPATKAHEWGWIYEIYSDEEFPAALERFSLKMSQMPAIALAGIKKAINASLQNSLDEQLNLERELQIQAGQTEDFREGIAAFREKRRPLFTGR